MRKFNSKKIVSLFLALMMLVGVMSISVFAAETETQTEESAQVVYKNVWIGEMINIMFALPTADIDGKEVVITANDEVVSQYGTDELEDVALTTYIVNTGVAAQNIDRIYNVAVEIDGETVAEFTYSVLEYIYERLYVDGVDGAEKEMLNNLIAFADSADKFLNGDATGIADKYVYVNTVDCTFDGGKTAGIVEKGAVLTDVASELVIPAGGKLVYNVADFDGSKIATVENIAEYVIENDCVITAEVQEPNVKQVTVLLATFNFGANGTAHNDGTSVTTYSETSGDYTLSIENGVKLYNKAFDDQGNSALKLGTGSDAASFTIAVPDGVDSVIIYVAGYKANNASIQVNGVSYTINTQSATGDYTAVEVDTTADKTIEFKTVSGGTRCMLDKIEFIGEKTVEAHDCEFVGATCVAKGVCEICGALDVDGEFGDHDWEDATCTTLKTCSICGKTDGELLPHFDSATDADHECDACGKKNVTEHIDSDGDTVCDNGCGVAIEAGGEVVQPQEYTETLSIFAKEGSAANDLIQWTSDYVTVSNAKDKSTSAIRTSDSDHYRVYASSKFTIAVDGGSIQKVVINCTNASYANVMSTSFTNSGYTCTVSGSDVTITITANDVDSISASMTAQSRIKEVSVTYTK